MAKKRKAALPRPEDIPGIIDHFPYNLDQSALITNRGSKSTVYRLIRTGAWPKPIKIGNKQAYLGSTLKAICSGEVALAA